MTTFKAEIAKGEKRKDGTYNIKIRITHKRKVRRYATQMYASDKDITRSGKIKNQAILDNADTIIREWRKRMLVLAERADIMEVEEVLKYLTSIPEGVGIPMFPWMERYIERIAQPGTRRNYQTAINVFRRYVGDITFQQLRTSTIKEYVDAYGMDKVASHLVHLRKMYREAMLTYNDDDIVRIPRDPFASIRIVIPSHVADRSTTIDTIRRIASIPSEQSESSVRNMARDMFLLSFMLMGTNLADLYEAETPKDGVLTYQRAKTKGKREDRAYISINILPQAQEIINRHKGKGKMLNLSARYTRRAIAQDCVQQGMKRIKQYLIEEYRSNEGTKGMSDEAIAQELHIENLTFYSARHSWATIGRNDLNIDKWTIHEGLNHVDATTRITDIYLKKDFTRINEANRLVVEHVFGKK